MKEVDREFFLLEPLDAVGKILGKVLLYQNAGGRIVEAEAYLGEEDPGSFAYKGRKGVKRDALYREPGSLFLYKVHGHVLLNIIFLEKGRPGAILIRALQPLYGTEAMKRRRGRERLEELCSGPGKLTQALGMDLSLDGSIINQGPVRLLEGSLRPGEKVGFSSRIGIKEGRELPYRVFIKNSRFLSRRGDSNP